MNILIFVTSLLMIFALLTYGRLDMYRSFIVTQGEFERYMAEGERRAFNRGAQQWYDWTALSQKNGGSKKPASKDASPKINLYWMFHPEERQAHQQVDTTYRDLLKRLIYIVFGDHQEFKKAIDKNPNLVDDLIQAIEKAGSQLTADKTPLKTVYGLENLDLDNPALQDTYYWMVKGFHLPQPEKKKENKETSEIGAREEPTENQAENLIPQEGVVSLLDFLTIQSNKTKIRVFLAPKAILLAIFGDPHTVDEIMQNRIEMSNTKETDYSNLSEQFKQKFAPLAINVPETMLDFTVSGTDPRNYEVQP